MPVDRATAQRLADEYRRVMRENDTDAMLELFSDDAVVWHNTDEAEEPIKRTAKVVGWMHKTVPDVQWTDVDLLLTDTGFVWRSLLTGTAPGGPISAHTCVVVSADDAGKLTRIDEYIDPTGLKALSG